jgi:hypothetical protein
MKHDSTKARCKACLKTFSVHCDGKSAVEKHMNSNAQENYEFIQKNCSLALFIISKHELDKISATECVFVYHGVKHGHSCMSQKCTIDLVRTVFESSSSSVTKSMSCGKTKVSSLAFSY